MNNEIHWEKKYHDLKEEYDKLKKEYDELDRWSDNARSDFRKMRCYRRSSK